MNEAYFAMRMLADEENRKKLLIIILIPILFFIVAMLVTSDMGTTAGTAASPLSDQVEKWRPMVTQYCTKYKIPGYVDLALALMQVESSGNEPDPMQAAEGAYGLYCLKTKNFSKISFVLKLSNWLCKFNLCSSVRTVSDTAVLRSKLIQTINISVLCFA